MEILMGGLRGNCGEKLEAKITLARKASVDVDDQTRSTKPEPPLHLPHCQGGGGGWSGGSQRQGEEARARP